MSEPFLGEIKIISWNFPPKGWAFCNGQLLPNKPESGAIVRFSARLTAATGFRPSVCRTCKAACLFMSATGSSWVSWQVTAHTLNIRRNSRPHPFPRSRPGGSKQRHAGPGWREGACSIVGIRRFSACTIRGQHLQFSRASQISIRHASVSQAATSHTTICHPTWCLTSSLRCKAFFPCGIDARSMSWSHRRMVFYAIAANRQSFS